MILNPFKLRWLRQAHDLEIRDTGDLYRLVVLASVEELRLLVEGTAAQAFVAVNHDRMWGSIRTVTAAAADRRASHKAGWPTAVQSASKLLKVLLEA